ncbi:CRISP/Allergen/PR-1-like isoform X3 [Stegodyphus dumicola]|uniref:CRISP/Allergen/PR-1-like isoform X3 n=2 Tax=Stegodyphus dumicola TaxID=202533 RepID=UPI0015B1AA63|nr:CRISP/Allergen/PR-1-like isoform X3 [Stegodyphus dumicola]
MQRTIFYQLGTLKNCPEKMNEKVPLFLSILIALIGSLAADECPTLFLRYSQDHSYCKPANEACNILQSYETADDIEVILDEHNMYRSKIATGKEPSLPPATNMLQLVWDDELAAVAQKYAEQCKFEHDCSNCRRVQNFGVGQNLAIQTTNSPTPPQPDWKSAIKSWYDEIAYFSKNYISPFEPPLSEPTYGHFTQLIWAKTWRVGCGFVMHNADGVYTLLYVCNYGPSGNISPENVYNKGHACDECPVNSCCEKTCDSEKVYPGLCKITDNKAPTYKPKGLNLFYCDFNGQSDCDFYVTGESKWEIYTTLSGNYLSTVLNGGENSKIEFQNHIFPTSAPFCFSITYRKGPNLDGQEAENTLEENFVIIGAGTSNQILPDFNPEATHQFSRYDMTLPWSIETQLSLSFSVPPDAAAQFLEIKKLVAKPGPCKT